MRYTKTIDLWAEGVQTAIINGNLRIQPGQWVRCGSGPRSRFVGVKPSGIFWVAHYQGNKYSTNRRFTQLMENF